MKLSAWKTAAAVLLFLGVTAGGVKAQETGCTNFSLQGDYAFTVSGQIFLATPGGPVTVQREGVAMTHFDGAGKLTQVDFVLSSPNAPVPTTPPPPPPTDPVTGFHNQESGTYQVFSDCTGTFTINAPSTSPVITVKFVLSDGGASIHTIVTSLTLPGMVAATPALIHSDGHRLGRIRLFWE